VAAGLLAPSAGQVSVLGAELTGINWAAGYLFQQDAVMPWKTARDNVAIGLEVAGIGRAKAAAAAQAWLERVGLGAFAERYPHQLSGGQRKRVGLAQVLIRAPKILLMDEPFGPLDAQTRQIMGNLLLELWALDRKAVLFVTHDLEEAIALADRVIIMSAGPAAYHRRSHHRPGSAARCQRGPPLPALPRAAQADLGSAEDRGAQGL
jgi:NitT/TauT family transport system ATP-binding protein